MARAFLLIEALDGEERRVEFLERTRLLRHLRDQVLTALSFFATGTYQKPVGMSFLHGLSQPSVSKATKEVTNALNNRDILQKYIRFPQTQN